MSEDGSMARRPELEQFARHHRLKIGTIADLIRYRLNTERSVERIAEQQVQTEFGTFRMYCYEDHVHRDVHLALAHGDLAAGVPLVRVHLTETLRDLIGVRDGSRAWTLRAALQRIAESPCGVAVILRHSETPRELADSVRALERVGASEPRAPASGHVLRKHGIGAQILHDLGVRRMRVLSAPKQFYGIAAFDLEIVDYVDESG
jgi:3,4-dihydroxy 2-butanone 4-phosphate synthase/GTP cyclohydrolase II